MSAKEEEKRRNQSAGRVGTGRNAPLGVDVIAAGESSRKSCLLRNADSPAISAVLGSLL